MNNILDKTISLIEPGHKYVLEINPDLKNAEWLPDVVLSWNTTIAIGAIGKGEKDNMAEQIPLINHGLTKISHNDLMKIHTCNL